MVTTRSTDAEDSPPSLSTASTPIDIDGHFHIESPQLSAVSGHDITIIGLIRDDGNFKFKGLEELQKEVCNFYLEAVCTSSAQLESFGMPHISATRIDGGTTALYNFKTFEAHLRKSPTGDIAGSYEWSLAVFWSRIRTRVPRDPHGGEDSDDSTTTTSDHVFEFKTPSKVPSNAHPPSVNTPHDTSPPITTNPLLTSFTGPAFVQSQHPLNSPLIFSQTIPLPAPRFAGATGLAPPLGPGAPQFREYHDASRPEPHGWYLADGSCLPAPSNTSANYKAFTTYSPSLNDSKPHHVLKWYERFAACGLSYGIFIPPSDMLDPNCPTGLCDMTTLPARLREKIPVMSNIILNRLTTAISITKFPQLHARVLCSGLDGYVALYSLIQPYHPKLCAAPGTMTARSPMQLKTESVLEFVTRCNSFFEIESSENRSRQPLEALQFIAFNVAPSYRSFFAKTIQEYWINDLKRPLFQLHRCSTTFDSFLDLPGAPPRLPADDPQASPDSTRPRSDFTRGRLPYSSRRFQDRQPTGSVNHLSENVDTLDEMETANETDWFDSTEYQTFNDFSDQICHAIQSPLINSKPNPCSICKKDGHRPSECEQVLQHVQVDQFLRRFPKVKETVLQTLLSKFRRTEDRVNKISEQYDSSIPFGTEES
jgi:hypothetical protein